MRRPSWHELQAIKMLGEQRSFRRTAEMLGLKRSSLSHLVKTLEHNLGVQLFQRTTRSVSLTDAGQQLLDRLSPLLNQMDDVLHDISASRHQHYGTLRISASDASIGLLLDHVVADFSARYPDIQLDFAAQGTLVDITAAGFDAGIRLIEDVPQDMVAVPLGGPLTFLTVAAPAYLARNASILHPRDLLQQQCIRQRLPSGKRYQWEYAQAGEKHEIDVPGTLTLDSNALMAQAALAGLGIAYVPSLYVEKEMRSGQLVELLADWRVQSAGIALWFPPNRHQSMALRLFIDALKISLPRPT
ncbi:transcriptional regulator, LysR family [Candidatus Pantoea symbiotica]|jgi:DNA-binding transcriptional LysR family regulator|uniref:Transcriptional regulator, LysR family n=1 Tax=Candidatus Pantoea symbiotica TaxID=1884370 RepID=A0A1I4E7T7_9GAMM|nr:MULTISPECIES: LysR family transcriptional regulator [Pantoea]KAJ9431425.1 LysR family transcriptional regulator [Pantoea sp. YR343]MRT26290.1 LysR family transcriptional regulator [Enterobacteriaceae bacterium RIT697]SFL01832.1 transcriptional regulator, LysR family [Pantoea symbiotica]SFV07651.1 transcriptional regulator, LysR family [Pantoea sp. YR525]